MSEERLLEIQEQLKAFEQEIKSSCTERAAGDVVHYLGESSYWIGCILLGMKKGN